MFDFLNFDFFLNKMDKTVPLLQQVCNVLILYVYNPIFPRVGEGPEVLGVLRQLLVNLV